MSSIVAQGRGAEAGSVERISAQDIDEAVIAALRPRSLGGADDRALVAEHLGRAVVARDGVEITLTDGDTIRNALSRRSSTRKILGLSDASTVPKKAEARAVLLRWTALDRRYVADLERGRSVDLDQLADRHGCSRRHLDRMIDYAFLAPDLVQAIAEGRLPRGVNARALSDAPMLWSAQW